MSKICQITGKKAMVGNNVSHSKRRTKRKFDVNLFTKKFYWVEQNCWVSLNISAAGFIFWSLWLFRLLEGLEKTGRYILTRKKMVFGKMIK